MKSKNIQLLLQNQVWDDKTDRPMYNDNVFSLKLTVNYLRKG